MADACRAAGQNDRQTAAALECPRSTLPGWAQADGAVRDAPSALASFIAALADLHWLHRLASALHSLIARRAGGVTLWVCQCSHLSGFSEFVGISYDSQPALNVVSELAFVEVATA
jgi:hypothetical protein